MKRIFAALMLSLILLMPASAQTPRVAQLSISHQSEWLYPMGIAFSLLINAPPTDISSLVMTVSQDGWAGQTQSIDLSGLEPDALVTQLSSLWQIPVDAPQLFKPLTFTWIAESGTGLITATETLEFADPRFRWKLETGGEMIIAVAGGAQFVVYNEAITALNDILSADTDKPAPVLRAVVYPDSAVVNPCAAEGDLVAALTGATIACDSGAVDRLLSSQGFQVVQVSSISPSAVLNGLASAQITHAFEGIQDNPGVPEWFKSGLIAFYSPVSKSDALQNARIAQRAGQLLNTLERIPTDATGRNLWESQAVGWVQYMAYRAGFEAVRALASQLEQGADFALALESLSLSVPVIDTGWRAWLFSNAADNLYGLNAGNAPTATPLPSSTATQTPIPTHTPTPSPTHTPTFTASPTERDLATLRPTQTFTPSLTPSQTVTLRPALGFDLMATPTLTLVENTATDTSEFPWELAGIALVTLFATGVMAYLVVRKRRRN